MELKPNIQMTAEDKSAMAEDVYCWDDIVELHEQKQQKSEIMGNKMQVFVVTYNGTYPTHGGR